MSHKGERKRHRRRRQHGARADAPPPSATVHHDRDDDDLEGEDIETEDKNENKETYEKSRMLSSRAPVGTQIEYDQETKKPKKIVTRRPHGSE